MPTGAIFSIFIIGVVILFLINTIVGTIFLIKFLKSRKSKTTTVEPR